MATRTAFILKGYPRISETFIAQEIRALETRGLDISIFSLRHPTDAHRHPVHNEIRAPVTYLPEYLHHEPARVVRSWWRQRRRFFRGEAWRAFGREFVRKPSRARIRRFGQALILACELPSETRLLHAHFLHSPSTVAHYASLLTGIPWSCSAHAKDIWTSSEWDKRLKLEHCSWLVTCTRINLRHLRSLTPATDKLNLVYHGIDLSRFPPPEKGRPSRDGTSPDDPAIVVSVGRTVEKKGYEDLLQALAELPEDCCWTFVHIGGGELLESLKQAASRLGIEGRVTWRGVQPRDVVLEALRKADLFVLPCRVASNGDRDGLPNVLLEAQSQKLACLSTQVSGIPELIEDGRTGILVPERDIPALSRALKKLISDPDLRAHLGEAGYTRVRDKFGMQAQIDRLIPLFSSLKSDSSPGEGG